MIKGIRLKGTTFSDDYDNTLVKAEAVCKDLRTKENVVLTFFFDRNIPEYNRNKETISRMIMNTVKEYGFEYIRMKSFDYATYENDAEAMWMQYADEAC